MKTKRTTGTLAVTGMIAGTLIALLQSAVAETSVLAVPDMMDETTGSEFVACEMPAGFIEASGTQTELTQEEVTTTADPVKPIRVAVVDFASAGGESFTSCNVTVSPMTEAGSELSDAIASQMATWPEYTIVDRDEVERVINEQNLSAKGQCTPATLQQLAFLLDVELVVVGQTDGTVWSGKGHAGGSLYASIQMLSASDSTVLWSIDGSVTDTNSSRQLIPSLADDMTGRLYAQIQTVEFVRPMLAMHTPDR